tara:strand:- start:8754 stop:9749 length:996 start_codon:yes stop_codon:yes gene_type:complete
MNGLALCAGVGGLELGLSLAIPGYRCVGYCERDSYAASAIVARMEESTLDQAPIWDDIGSFKGELYRNRVDIVSAGFPCQPFSVAGRRDGTRDERWTWEDIARIIREVRPRYVFLENVPGLLTDTGGYGTVLASLAQVGFDAEWDVFSAEGVGAPHLRRRVFILAWSVSDTSLDTLRVITERGSGSSLSPLAGNTEPPDVGEKGMAHLNEGGFPRFGGSGLYNRERETFGNDVDGCGKSMGDTQGGGRVQAITGSASRRRPFPPGPGEAEEWAELIREDPSIEPAVCGVLDGTSSRVDRLRCCGNSVVPVVAAVAFRTLAARAGITINMED